MPYFFRPSVIGSDMHFKGVPVLEEETLGAREVYGSLRLCFHFSEPLYSHHLCLLFRSRLLFIPTGKRSFIPKECGPSLHSSGALYPVPYLYDYVSLLLMKVLIPTIHAGE